MDEADVITEIGDIYTFTPTITVNGSPLSTPTATITWLNRIYCGPNASSTTILTADILALDGANGASAL